MQAENPKISVIIPVHNTEKYLRACLDSVANQTFQDFEAIIIDNNSPDNSAKIITEYVNKYPNFKTYKKIGGGLSGARNCGLKYVKGEFLFFLDSDDTIDDNTLSVLYDTSQKYNADIVTCTSKRIDTEGNLWDKNKTNYGQEFLISDLKDGKVKLLKSLGQNACAWGKLFKSNIFTDNDFTFPENALYEDVALITTTSLFINNLYVLNKPLYNYRYVPSSISNTKKHLAPKSLFNNFALLRPKLQKYSFFKNDIREEWEYRLMHMIIGGEGIGNGGLKKLSKQEVKEFFTLVKDFYLSLPKDFFASRNIVFRQKYALFLFALEHNYYDMHKYTRFFINIFYAIYKIFNRGK